MSNMSYCRFRNTLKDLGDCLESLRCGENLSESESAAFNEMIKVCKEIVEFSPDDPKEEKIHGDPPKAERTAVVVDGAAGRYLPQRFILDHYKYDMRWVGADAEDVEIVGNGPDTEGYDEAWEMILANTRYVDRDGVEWKLWQDGDLFAYNGTGEQWT